MATVTITGGTGLIGTALSSMLAENGYDVIILSRNPVETAAKNEYKETTSAFRHHGKIYYSRWDVANGYIDPSALAQTDYIIHLAGAGVADKPWTSARKKEILESRTTSGELLVKALKTHPHKVKAVISASAIGWYGPDNSVAFTEDQAPANDFLGKTCVAWENSIQPVESLGIRLAILRLGIVLSEKGGALAEFRKPLFTGVAAILGNGQQIISWIHITDICRLFMYALENESFTGIFNAVTPNPVTNESLVQQLAKNLTGKKHLSIHVPAFALKLLLGEMSVEVLKSCTVNGNKIQNNGFECLYPTIEKALDNIYPPVTK
jgi:uncharacterized protein (TIGR01777 family)